MLILLGAFVFWLALNGRLGLYAGFASTAAAGGGGSILSGFSIPVTVSLFGASGTPGASTTPNPSVPGGGAGLLGPQLPGGGYTPDPNSPNVLVPNATFLQPLNSLISGITPQNSGPTVGQ